MTTTPATIRKQITKLAELTDVVRARIDPTLQHLAGQLSILDGYPTTASGADRQPGGQRTILVDGDHVPVTGVEAVALRRLEHTGSFARGPIAALDELDEYLTTAITALGVVIRECERHTAIFGADMSRHRCIGTGDAQGATCTQIACPRPHIDGSGQTVNDHRCLDCGRTFDRAEQQAEVDREAERRMRIETARRLRRRGAA